ncbi:MAG: TetR/AcrR family transcriptional regulator [Gammaproteobacteria bacterium]
MPTSSPARPAATATRERILDAAERLFAGAGYDAVSLRMITREAGVELALANYHFGPKLELFRAVVERRASDLNAARMAALEALAPDAPLEAIIDAFSGPFLSRSLHGGPGWKAYARVIAQVANSERWTHALMSAYFDPVAHAFVARMRARLPRARAEDIYWGFHFLIGAMTITFAETGRIDVLSAGRCASSDLATIHARMLPFLAAGFRAICASDGISGETGRQGHE